jgi:hypothetical protein
VQPINIQTNTFDSTAPASPVDVLAPAPAATPEPPALQ